ncbi:MAG: DUF2237 domain-containing protein [Deltaproteobacteria bacterium]|nr:DUF2237 domain-containing protein [Deltaproteobacteria bacterium]
MSSGRPARSTRTAPPPTGPLPGATRRLAATPATVTAFPVVLAAAATARWSRTTAPAPGRCFSSRSSGSCAAAVTDVTQRGYEVLPSVNVLGTPLQGCSLNPKTGFYRDGCCNTGPDDVGSHTVCVQVNRTFLDFSRAVGNDLSTPAPQYGFAGLSPGDRWCLCAARWQQAFEAGKAPPVVLQATHQRALETCGLDDLLRHAVAASV